MAQVLFGKQLCKLFVQLIENLLKMMYTVILKYKYTTDEYGRIKTVTGNLILTKGKRNSAAQSYAGGTDRHRGIINKDDKDDGGHLIATIFNGDGDFANLVPMNSNLNRGAWKTMENNWVTLIDQGCEVTVTIKIKYKDDSSLRPEYFDILTKAYNPILDDDETGVQRFKNNENQIFNEGERVEFNV